ncbi:hypothetical protein M6D81_13890 [Paenibacillus sp. J5C_2022]|uniref:hypothetical protein n=1 Tax=Paenibacillus sp. J5C2022 TaxID=2977129 RepID=UPI0021CF118C|nr:hypothetical protein [Paenibacillus sp. J5C2022]MCU6709784.1 hypothetical protein [Paenibacillus sp. J5C2022]
MLFVSEIIPMEYHRKRVILADTESDKIGEMVYGGYWSDAYIRENAPRVYGKSDEVRGITKKPKKGRKRNV